MVLWPMFIYNIHLLGTCTCILHLEWNPKAQAKSEAEISLGPELLFDGHRSEIMRATWYSVQIIRAQTWSDTPVYRAS